jgi:hypothetical protein
MLGFLNSSIGQKAVLLIVVSVSEESQYSTERSKSKREGRDCGLSADVKRGGGTPKSKGTPRTWSVPLTLLKNVLQVQYGLAVPLI